MDAKRTLEKIRSVYTEAQTVEVMDEIVDLTELFLVRSYCIAKLLESQLNREQKAREANAISPESATREDVDTLVKTNDFLAFGHAVSASLRHGDWSRESNKDHEPKKKEVHLIVDQVGDIRDVRYTFMTAKGDYDVLELADACLKAWEVFCDKWGIELVWQIDEDESA